MPFDFFVRKFYLGRDWNPQPLGLANARWTQIQKRLRTPTSCSTLRKYIRLRGRKKKIRSKGQNRTQFGDKNNTSTLGRTVGEEGLLRSLSLPVPKYYFGKSCKRSSSRRKRRSQTQRDGEAKKVSRNFFRWLVVFWSYRIRSFLIFVRKWENNFHLTCLVLWFDYHIFCRFSRVGGCGFLACWVYFFWDIFKREDRLTISHIRASHAKGISWWAMVWLGSDHWLHFLGILSWLFFYIWYCLAPGRLKGHDVCISAFLNIML